MKTLIVSALLATIGALIAAPIPKESEKLPPPTEKQFEQSRTNLLMLGIAIHSYHDAMGKMPADIVDKDGKAILSWRVLMLPYLEEDALSRAFKLDEPWDSKANKALVERIPKPLAPIRVNVVKGHTFYRGFNGPDTVFEAGTKQTLVSMTDGTSNTVMVAEQSGLVGKDDFRNGYFTPWGGTTMSQPLSSMPPGRDMWGMGLSCVAYANNSKTAAAGANTSYVGNTILNSFHTGGINVLLTDGSVRFLQDSVDFVTYQRLCTRADGFVANLP